MNCVALKVRKCVDCCASYTHAHFAVIRCPACREKRHKKHESEKGKRSYQRHKEKKKAAVAARRVPYSQWTDETRKKFNESKRLSRIRAKPGFKASKHDAHVKAWKNWKRKEHTKNKKNFMCAFIGPPVPTVNSIGAAALERWKVRNNVQHALHVRMRVQIRKALKGLKAGRRWESLVGYDVHTLYKHLIRQIPKGYTAEDLHGGRLHIDHIIPKSSFDVTKPDELRACWALPNLRPLPAHENHSKHARRTHLL